MIHAYYLGEARCDTRFIVLINTIAGGVVDPLPEDRVGEEAAEQVLLNWAVEQYTAGVASLSELAARTDLPLEAIAQQVTESRAQEATEVYLAGCQRLARDLNLPQFYTAAKKAAKQAAGERGRQ